jgi:3-isopropylmalate/(R)-2-methylmalate dehydratase small subunit
MKRLKQISSRTVVMAATNIDTDQIYPARFLTTASKAGLGKLLFADWRYLGDGSLNPDFILNKPEAQGAQILVAGANFGSGSSREHAPWSLFDYGFRAIISTEIADIFRGNCLKSGLLPVMINEPTFRWLIDNPGALVTVDLESTRLKLPTGESINFQIEPFARHCLLNGIDELAFLQSHLPDIARYEGRQEK